jgi:hypothetical protein
VCGDSKKLLDSVGPRAALGCAGPRARHSIEVTSI